MTLLLFFLLLIIKCHLMSLNSAERIIKQYIDIVYSGLTIDALWKHITIILKSTCQ